MPMPKLPWVLQESENGGGLLMKPVPGQVICQFDETPDMQKVAKFVLRACNMHYELLSALRRLAQYDTYETEYDGRMYTLCPACREADGAHKDDCDFAVARKLLGALGRAP